MYTHSDLQNVRTLTALDAEFYIFTRTKHKICVCVCVFVCNVLWRMLHVLFEGRRIARRVDFFIIVEMRFGPSLIIYTLCAKKAGITLRCTFTLNHMNIVR